MNQQEEEQKEAAIQSFKEFTGNHDASDAARLLERCNWDVQRAINIFFMRNNNTGGGQEPFAEVVATAYDQPQHPPAVKRISHFNKRHQEEKHGLAYGPEIRRPHQNDEQFDDSIQVIEENGENSDIQMLDDDNHLPDNSSKIGKNSQSDDSGRIRDPIPAIRGVMLAQSYQQTYQNGQSTTAVNPNPFFPSSTADQVAQQDQMMAADPSSSAKIDFKQRQATHRMAMEKYHKPQKHNQRLSADEEQKKGNGKHAVTGAAEELIGGFGQHAERSRRDLRILFRPPVEMIFQGDWDQTLQAARQKNVWLLVNVQNSTEFASAVLNRDIWSAEAVKEVIQQNFLFWQVYHDTSDAIRIHGYYGFNTYPAIFILDPRTGEEVLKLQAPDPVTFLDNLTTFLAHYPTFEERDQQFRQLALQGRILPTTMGELTSEELLMRADDKDKREQKISNNAIDSGRPEVASPSGKKRKQPTAMEEGSSSGGDEFHEADAEEMSREANRQAKKMKRVVIISDMEPSTSTTLSASSQSTLWSSSTIKNEAKKKIDPAEWRKWIVPVDTIQTEMPRIHIQLRLPDGQRQRHQFWAQSPLNAIFSLVANLGMDPDEHQLILDFPRREFLSDDQTLLGLTLQTLGFGKQEVVNVEKRA